MGLLADAFVVLLLHLVGWSSSRRSMGSTSPCTSKCDNLVVLVLLVVGSCSAFSMGAFSMACSSSRLMLLVLLLLFLLLLHLVALRSFCVSRMS